MIEQDQAQRLRELVRVTAQHGAEEVRAPMNVVISGGCQQARVTAVANSLAAELRRQSLLVELQLADTGCIVHENDFVIVDAGAGYRAEFADPWRKADIVLLVASPHRDEVLETYATLKLVRAELPQLPVYLVIDRCESSVVANELASRISDASDRFLGMATPLAGWIPPTEAESPLLASFSELAQFLIERRQTALATLARKAAA